MYPHTPTDTKRDEETRSEYVHICTRTNIGASVYIQTETTYAYDADGEDTS